MQEIWKPVVGYEGLYEISNLGRVKSLPRNGTSFSEKILQHSIAKGYRQVILSKNNERKSVTIHRLVATAFLPNEKNYPCINHKDENKQNNDVSNLEWCSYAYNNTYNDRAKKASKKTGKKVLCVELNTIFNSLAEAERATNIKAGNICWCCKGNWLSAGGYHWRYADERGWKYGFIQEKRNGIGRNKSG